MHQTLETYLDIFCNCEWNNWFKLLSLAEFTYNNTFQNSTKMSFFFANYSFHLSFFGGSRSSPGSLSPFHVTSTTEEFTFYLHEVYQYLMQNLK